MPEREPRRENLSASRRSAERIAQVLKWSAPDSLIARAAGLISPQPKPIVRYPSGDVITADYQHAALPFLPAFGLKVEGEASISATPEAIESVINRQGPKDFRGKTQVQQDEALLLHGILSYGEANRVLPGTNARHVEHAILGAHLSNAQTTSQLDGSERIYFPYIPEDVSYSEPRGAKMVQLVTGRTGKEWEAGDLKYSEIQDLRAMVKNRGVRQVLDSIQDHAVTVEEKSYGGVTYIQVTDTKGTRRLVNTELSEEVQVEWVTFGDRFNGAEFAKITDRDGIVHTVHELLSEEVTAEILKGRKLMMVFGASGANADHFSKGWFDQQDHLLVAAVGRNKAKLGQIGSVDKDNVDRRIPIPEELRLQYDPEKPDAYDAARMDALLRSGLVFAVYDSTPVDNRLPNVKRVLPALVSGAVNRYITTKPVANTIPDYRELTETLKIKDINEQPVERRFFVHEHYIAKGPFVAFREHAQTIITALGRPVDLQISIQEKRTLKQEDREESVPYGIIQDLAPHAASMALALLRDINESGRYHVDSRGKSNGIDPLLAKVRDTTSTLGTYTYVNPATQERAEVPYDTGFVVKGDINTEDRVLGTSHDLSMTWIGAKGADKDDKRVTITFEHPDNHERSSITIPLMKVNGEYQFIFDNVPEDIRNLFTNVLDDNGYQGATASAITNDHPEYTFQRLSEARTVRAVEEYLRRLSNGKSPTEYEVGEPILSAARRGQGTQEPEEKLARVS